MTELLSFSETGEASLTRSQWLRQRFLDEMVRPFEVNAPTRREMMATWYWSHRPAEIPECWPVESDDG